MLQVGDNVEWIKIKQNSRDWYGKLLEINDDKYHVEWIKRPGVFEYNWEPIERIRKIESVPVMERKSKLMVEDLIETTDLPEPGLFWRDEAQCFGKDLSKFFYATPRPTNKLRKELEDICKECPVLIDCRSFAIRTSSVGWFGGMDEPSRVKWLQNLPRV